MNPLSRLSGQRTYILAALGAIIVGLKMAGILSPEAADSLLTILGVGSVASLRAAIPSPK